MKLNYFIFIPIIILILIILIILTPSEYPQMHMIPIPTSAPPTTVVSHHVNLIQKS